MSVFWNNALVKLLLGGMTIKSRTLSNSWTWTGTWTWEKKHPSWETDTLEKLDLKNWKRCHLPHVIWKTMLKWFIFIRKLAVCKALFSWKNVWKKYQKLIFRKRRSWYKNINCQSVALISMKCFRLFTFFQAVSFSIKMCFYETSDIFYFECHTYFQKVFSCLKFQ